LVLLRLWFWLLYCSLFCVLKQKIWFEWLPIAKFLSSLKRQGDENIGPPVSNFQTLKQKKKKKKKKIYLKKKKKKKIINKYIDVK